jgi:hypothetical protein
MGARLANAIVGLWLFVSAFLWPHETAQRSNALGVGIVVVTAALAGLMGQRWGRYLNALLGGWLIVSALFWGDSRATFINHMVVGFLLAAFGLSPSWTALRRREPIRP